MEPRETRLLPRGDWMSDAGALLQPAIPEFLGKLDTGDRRANRLEARGLGLARQAGPERRATSASLLSLTRLPHDDRAVTSARGQHPAIGGKGDALYTLGVTLQSVKLAPTLDLP